MASVASKRDNALDVLTLEEAAAFLRIPAAQVVKLVAEQGLVGRQIGTEWRFHRDALREWLVKPAGKWALLAQAGALKDDPTLPEVLKSLERDRRQKKSKKRV